MWLDTSTVVSNSNSRVRPVGPVNGYWVGSALTFLAGRRRAVRCPMPLAA
ncbi:hypothetical protein [Mycobacterium sp. 3519A]|nr:hypothetical protein [Mycobacterium sp. 3519A]